MSQTRTTVEGPTATKNMDGQFRVEVLNGRSKQLMDSQLITKKTSLPNVSSKRLQKESLIQELVDCLESNKLEIQKLEEIIKYKDKTIRVFQKRHFQSEKTSEQTLRLQTLLREKSSSLDKLSVFLKTVSERIEAIRNMGIFKQFKGDDQAEVNRTLNSISNLNEVNEGEPNDEFNCSGILINLDELQRLLSKLSEAGPVKPESVLDISSISYVQMPLEQSSYNLQFQQAKNNKISQEKNVLADLLRQSETSRLELANKVESEYNRIKAQMKDKSAYPPECVDDLTSLILKTQRQEKLIQQYAVELVKVRNNFTMQMRQTLQKIWGIQKACEKKDNQIAMLKDKLQMV